MLWMINCTDKPGTEALRTQHLPEHRVYLANQADRIFFCGPHLDDTGHQMIGSLFVIQATDRSDAEAFIRQETLNKAGVFIEVKIVRMRKGRLLPALAETD